MQNGKLMVPLLQTLRGSTSYILGLLQESDSEEVSIWECRFNVFVVMVVVPQTCSVVPIANMDLGSLLLVEYLKVLSETQGKSGTGRNIHCKDPKGNLSYQVTKVNGWVGGWGVGCQY